MSFITNSLNAIFPDESKKTIKALTPLVDAVFSHEDDLKTLSSLELIHKSLELKARVMKELEGLKGDELKAVEKNPFLVTNENKHILDDPQRIHNVHLTVLF